MMGLTVITGAIQVGVLANFHNDERQCFAEFSTLMMIHRNKNTFLSFVFESLMHAQ